MRIVKFALLFVGLVALLVVPVLAQDATPTPVPDQQAQTDAQGQTQAQIPAGQGFMRFANFLTDAGVVDVYVNDQLGFADVNPNGFSGWLELPSGRHNVTFVPAGEPIEQAIVGPFEVTAGGNSRMTIAATGSGDTGAFDWMLIREDVAGQADANLQGNPGIRLLHNM
jgi:hypothetical protein